jgi:hypothetical protein
MIEQKKSILGNEQQEGDQASAGSSPNLPKDYRTEYLRPSAITSTDQEDDARTNTIPSPSTEVPSWRREYLRDLPPSPSSTGHDLDRER